MLLQTKSITRLSRIRGLTSMELLATVGSLGILLTVAIVVITPLLSDVRKVKLDNSVTSLNRALDSFQAEGGDVSAVTTAGDALNLLKTTASQTDIIAGYKGSYIDPRLDTKLLAPAETASSAWRALWDDAKKRFVVAQSGSNGIEEFWFNESLLGNDYGTEEREVLNELATQDKWIWDFTDTAPGAQLASDFAETEDPVSAGAPGNPDALNQLLPPEFDPPGGMFEFFDFPSVVTLSNPNDTSTTTIQYTLNGSGWQDYTGPIPVSRDDQISAYVKRNVSAPDVFNSFTSTHFYRSENPNLSGTSSGAFKDVVGASGLVSNISPGDTDDDFYYGAQLNGGDQNRLQFTGDSFTDIAPDEIFNVGQLTYLNSTTGVGTSAYEVTLQLDLSFSNPSASESVDVKLALESTKNYPWYTQDQQADFVRFEQINTDFSTFFQGQTYYLNLEFVYSGSEGYSAVDSFHVHEGKSATANIVGYFSEVPKDRPDTGGGSGGSGTPPPPSLP